ncbi:MAG: threonine/serine exporter family protein [bacterium]|nr:threonine/serine exporter family protein [bacterium]MDN5835694.1 threonine/serine exporter family protein [bacterium]
MKFRFWPKRIKDTDPTANMSTSGFDFEKIGENLTPNMRALRLAMTMSDMLLSMNVSANSVVSKALDITETYCKQPVHIDINANILMLSQLRGIDKEPLTFIRPVALRKINNMVVQEIQRLVYEIHNGQYSLEQAEAKLERIIKNTPHYPWWLTMLGNGGIVAGVSLMFTSSWHVILTTFVIGLAVDRLIALMTKHAIPSFFRQAGASLFVTLSAAFLAFLSKSGFTFFDGMNPTLIVVGGIIMLVAGLTIVSALQDAIYDYYVTATAHILKVGMLTTGIVVGILIGLYLARMFGMGIAVSATPLQLNELHFQVIGAGIAAGAYALATQTKFRALIWAAVVGGSALGLMYIARHSGISVIPASGIAAAFAGLIASFLSRLWQTPSSGIVAAGIVPLVPGLAIYTGLMQLIAYPTGDAMFTIGIGTLFSAVATALAIAAGASFGVMIGQPLRQKITHSRNIVPFANFMRRQLKFDRRLRLSRTALRHHPVSKAIVEAEPEEDDSIKNGTI